MSCTMRTSMSGKSKSKLSLEPSWTNSLAKLDRRSPTAKWSESVLCHIEDSWAGYAPPDLLSRFWGMCEVLRSLTKTVLLHWPEDIPRRRLFHSFSLLFHLKTRSTDCLPTVGNRYIGFLQHIPINFPKVLPLLRCFEFGLATSSNRLQKVCRWFHLC